MIFVMFSFDWRVNVHALHENFKQHIATFPADLLDKTFDGPTLFIGGSKSDYIRQFNVWIFCRLNSIISLFFSTRRPKDLPKIQKLFPNVRLEFLDCGHLVHVEKPHEFLTLVLDFVNN